MKTNIFVQHQGKETILDKKIDEVKKTIKEEGVLVKDIKALDIYAVPEENKLYYVVNGEPKGSIDLF